MAGILTQSIGIISGGAAAIGTVTLGNDAGTVGFDDDGTGTPFGSLVGITEIDGLVIEKLISFGSGDFQVVLGATVDPTQSHFTSITIQDGVGVDTLFETSNLQGGSYGHVGGATDQAFWTWGDGTNRLWEVGDVGEVKVFTVVI